MSQLDTTGIRRTVRGDPEQRRRAVLCVATRARGRVDCVEILACLGLDAVEGKPGPKRGTR